MKEGQIMISHTIISGDTHIQEDEATVDLRHRIGVENLLWGNDFPHSESTWPRSCEFLATMLAGVPEAEVRKLTCDNAARIFHFAL
jgi:predicted TIM-barrel fold metal-dependent hydrolase